MAVVGAFTGIGKAGGLGARSAEDCFSFLQSVMMVNEICLFIFVQSSPSGTAGESVDPQKYTLEIPKLYNYDFCAGHWLLLNRSEES